MPTPTHEGFWWGRHLRKAPGTADIGEPPNVNEWEVMHVVTNCLDPSDPEYLMVMVPGIEKWQALGDFAWGEEVIHAKSTT